jgi:hypothetical protein
MSFTDTILAAEEDLLVYRGDSLTVDYPLYTDEARTIPYTDLGDWTALKLQVRSEKTSLDVVIELEIGTGLSVASNVLTAVFTATQMDLLKDNYYYDIQGTNGTIIGTVVRGRIKRTDDVTK